MMPEISEKCNCNGGNQLDTFKWDFKLAGAWPYNKSVLFLCILPLTLDLEIE